MIPNHMDLTLWPNISFSDDYKNPQASFQVVIKKEWLDFTVAHGNGQRSYIGVTFMLRGTVIFTFTDTLDKNDRYNLNNFKREITEGKNKITKEEKESAEQKTFYFSDGKLVLLLEDKKVKYIKDIAKDFKASPKMLTLDLETRDIANKKKNTGATGNLYVYIWWGKSYIFYFWGSR